MTLASLAALAATPAFAKGLSPEDKALALKAAAGLQALNSVRGRFEQTDARGGRTTGVIYLQRPGKARFTYDPPSGLTVISDGQMVAIADTRMKTFSRYNLSATPLSLFLAKEVRLDRGVAITRVDRRPDGFSVTARDGVGRARGSITLHFGLGEPAPLQGWSLEDAQGAVTRVSILGLSNAALDPALFVIRDTRLRGGARPGM
jgi:outer membrane lipoprotein-sorting protein